ncbi:hypothetical protein [Azospirillum brasilense]|uniref:hypothetical protein n=1 Tax=Azospirillum brasilense TaxID=192 RepID=UPI001586D520|nr:hypothetical protein [Azospirillum brasilense]
MPDDGTERQAERAGHDRQQRGNHEALGADGEGTERQEGGRQQGSIRRALRGHWG